jgi:hypothetical protein
VFSVIVMRRAIDWALRSGPAAVRDTLLAMMVVAVSAWCVHTARARSVFDLARLEARFRGTGEYSARALPRNAMVLAVQQSGAIRYYGARGTLMWDAVPERDLDRVLAWLTRQNFAPLIAVEDGEDAWFRSRFGSQQSGRLDWPPMAEVHGPVRVRVYDPAGRAAFFSGVRAETEHVWPRRRGR